MSHENTLLDTLSCCVLLEMATSKDTTITKLTRQTSIEKLFIRSYSVDRFFFFSFS